jgi:hypothetical protein
MMELAMQTMMQLGSQWMRFGLSEVARLEFEVEVNGEVARQRQAQRQLAKSTAPTVVVDAEIDACAERRKERWGRRKESIKESVLLWSKERASQAIQMPRCITQSRAA